jgi:hypothetical protein
MWVAWYHVFYCSDTVRFVPDRVAKSLPEALLLVRDVIIDADVTCSAAVLVIIVTLLSYLLCRNLVTALYVLLCSLLKAIPTEETTGVPPFLLFRRRCLRRRLGSYSDYSANAPSLRQLVPNGSLIKCELTKMYQYYPGPRAPL